MIMDIENFGYVVYAGDRKEKYPVAIFSTAGHAEWLSDFIDSAFPFEKVDPTKHPDLEVDKYAGQIRAGLVPYNINMYADGAIHFDMEDTTSHVSEPEIVDTSEGKALSGTFWANGRSEAIEQAEQFRMKMIEEGKL